MNSNWEERERRLPTHMEMVYVSSIIKLSSNIEQKAHVLIPPKSFLYIFQGHPTAYIDLCIT